LGISHDAASVDHNIRRYALKYPVGPVHPANKRDANEGGQRFELRRRHGVFRGDGNDLETGVLLQLIIPVEERELPSTRAAPRGPEVDDEHAALIVRETDFSPVKRCRVKVWCGFPTMTSSACAAIVEQARSIATSIAGGVETVVISLVPAIDMVKLPGGKMLSWPARLGNCRI
jgi:hypothetical protein